MLVRESSNVSGNREKFTLFAIVCSIFFFIITLRLIQLQLIQGKQYKQFSEKNRITVKRVFALRGKITDRNGKILVDNRPSFDLTITRGYFGDKKDEVFGFLRKQLKLSEEQLANLEKKLKRTPKYDAVTVIEDIDWEIVANAKAHAYMLPGIDVAYRPMRLYPHGKLACHTLGYLREVSKNRLEEIRRQGREDITRGDYLGVWGVEKKFDDLLRGSNGSRPVVEDAYGRELGEATSDFLLPTLRKKDALPGYNLLLTLDLNLQKKTEEIFTHPAGAAIAMDPQNGDILAMVSKPCFDLSKFSRNIPAAYWSELRQDPLKPLYDRATMGIYPPGSTFKIVTASAGLRYGIAPTTVATSDYESCKGSYRIGRERKRCWRRYPGHGAVDVVTAMRSSCDVYFYQLGLALGVDRIAEEARRFGLGETTRLGLNHEQAGNVPTTSWKERVYKQPWVDGETASVAIGQGYLTTTPLQMVRTVAAIANGGQVIKPRILIRAEDVISDKTTPFPTEVLGDIGLDGESLSLIVEGLDQVTNTREGTAYWKGRSKKYRIAGKTGTAQMVKQELGEKVAPEFEDHAWFVAFAPKEDPKIAVVVLVENGGHGGSTAAPIAKQIIETYLDSINLPLQNASGPSLQENQQTERPQNG